MMNGLIENERRKIIINLVYYLETGSSERVEVVAVYFSRREIITNLSTGTALKFK